MLMENGRNEVRGPNLVICIMPKSPFLAVSPRFKLGVRQVRISVPLVECLLDGHKYFLPGDLAPAAGVDLRAIARPFGGRAERPVKSDRPPGRPRSSRKFEDNLVRTLGEPV